jgi:hypothetical protein
MEKFLRAMESGKPLQIKTAICCDHLKGYVYIEAVKQAHVKEVGS